MARITDKELIQPNIFDNLIDSTEKAEAAIESLTKRSKELGKQLEKSVEGIKIDQANIKNLQELNDLEKSSVKTKQEISKLQTRLNKLKAGEFDETFKLRAEINELNKEKREEAKESLKLIDAYQKQSKRLIALRKEYKSLVVQEGRATKESKKLLKEISRLDRELKDVDASAGQFQRNVGNYPETLADATKGLLQFAAAAGGTALSLKGIQDGLNATQEGSEDLREATGFLEGAWNQAKNTLGTFVVSVKDAFQALGDGKNPLLAIAAFNNIGKATGEAASKILGAGEAQVEVTRKTIDFEKELRKLNETVADQNAVLEVQNQRAGDTTLSLDQQEEALRKVAIANNARAIALKQIAQLELDIINATIESNDANKANVVLLNQQSDARIKLTEAIAEERSAIEEVAKISRDIALERFEIELDFALDVFDAQKTLNERRIADDRSTLDERKKIFIETQRLAESSFNSQQELLENITGREIDLRRLVALEDEKLVAEEAARITNVVKIRTRIINIIRDRKALIGDLIDLERELSAEIEERAKTEIDAANELQQFRIDRQIAEAKDIDERVEKEKQAAIFRSGVLLDSEELLADERKLIEEQLQDELTAIEKKGIEDREAKKKEALEKDIERASKFISALENQTALVGEELDKQNELRLQSIDDEISQNEQAIERQQELFDRGAENELASERRRQAELAIARREELERQRRQEEALELTQTFLRSLNARLANADTEAEVTAAPAKALADTVIARALAKTIAGAFAEGVEAFDGKGTTTSDSNLIRFSNKESVVTAKGTAENKGLVTAMNTGKSAVDAWINQNYGLQRGDLFTVNKTESNEQLVKTVQEVKRAVEEKPVPNWNWNKYGDLIEKQKYKSGTTTIIHRNRKPRV